MPELLLLRHGQSTWNLENRFTGWTDVDLSEQGIREARLAGQLLRAGGYEFDLVYTSVLKRAIRTIMKVAGLLDFATELHNPNFAQLAEAAGLLGLTAETPDQVRPMLAEALKHEGPALVEVLVHRQELAMPPTISLEQMTGFSLFMLKAVLSGRGDEVIDLVKTNLFR